jgi:CRP-like cAMP-binding protein
MLRLLGYLARSCRFRAGDTVMRQGEVEGRAYLVVSGRLTAVRERRGRIVSTLALGQGSLFGGLTLLSGVPRLHTVTADTDTECLALDRAEARTVLARFPEPGLLVVDRIVAQVFERQECGFRRASDLDDLGDGGAREDRKAGD